MHRTSTNRIYGNPLNVILAVFPLSKTPGAESNVHFSALLYFQHMCHDLRHGSFLVAADTSEAQMGTPGRIPNPVLATWKACRGSKGASLRVSMF